MTVTEMLDSDLVVASLRDPAVFDRLFVRHFDDIYRLVERRLGSQVAADVAAETFAVAFTKRASFDSSYDSARPWLVGIALRLVARERRQLARHFAALHRLEQQTPVARADSATVVETRWAWSRVRDALLILASKDREVLLLIAWDELTYDEAATALGIPIGTVRSRVHRARQRLRAALDEGEGSDG